jgi:hypothetical protein
MSFSDDLAAVSEPLEWWDFPRRDVESDPEEFLSLDQEMLTAARRHEQRVQRTRERGAADANAHRQALHVLAARVGRLEQLLAELREPLEARGARQQFDRLRVLKDQMLQDLADRGVEIRDPLGLAASEALEWTSVVSWERRAGLTTDQVVETQEVAVFQDGAPVRLAQVIMGAPLTVEDGREPAEFETETREGPSTSTEGAGE